jgi:peptidyl-tRNA hydrolase
MAEGKKERPEATTPSISGEDMNNEDRYVMYLVIPTSLKMSMGKTAAAVGHAVMLLGDMYRECEDYSEDLDPSEDIGPVDPMNWTTEDEEDAGTTRDELLRIYDNWHQADFPSYAKVVLGASQEEFEALLEYVSGRYGRRVMHVAVVDRGFSQVKPNTLTCIGLWPMRKSQAPDIIKKLKPLR